MASLTRRMQRVLTRRNKLSLQRGKLGQRLGTKNPNGGVYLREKK